MSQYRRPPAEWQGIARRVTYTSMETTVGRSALVSNLRQIKEFDAAGNVRRIWESTVNAQLSQTETVTVGSLTYSRRIGETWNQIASPADRPNDINSVFETNNAAARESTWVEPGSEVEFRVASGEHRGESVLICSRIQSIDKADPASGAKIKIETINKYWLSDRDRRIVKFEQIKISEGADLEVRSIIVSEWEADSSIVIKLPTGVLNRQP